MFLWPEKISAWKNPIPDEEIYQVAVPRFGWGFGDAMWWRRRGYGFVPHPPKYSRLRHMRRPRYAWFWFQQVWPPSAATTWRRCLSHLLALQFLQQLWLTGEVSLQDWLLLVCKAIEAVICDQEWQHGGEKTLLEPRVSGFWSESPNQSVTTEIQRLILRVGLFQKLLPNNHGLEPPTKRGLTMDWICFLQGSELDLQNHQWLEIPWFLGLEFLLHFLKKKSQFWQICFNWVAIIHPLVLIEPLTRSYLLINPIIPPEVRLFTYFLVVPSSNHFVRWYGWMSTTNCKMSEFQNRFASDLPVRKAS